LMRLFLAVELDEAVRCAAENIADDLRKRVDRVLHARWVPPSNMHLTVRFIGHVADERVADVVNAMEPALPVASFDVGLAECGVLPSHGPPRVVWLRVKDGLSSLQALHDHCNRRLVPLGFDAGNRPFNAHLTLARVKDAPRGSAAVAREAVRAVRASSAHCRVTEVVLFESRLSSAGATYVPRLRIPLRP
jgi:RNA 2',3'-cyclic 3'-phosphodiesterase